MLAHCPFSLISSISALASVTSSIEIKYGNFSVEVVDPVSDYLEQLENVFDFPLIKSLLSRSDFRFVFDAMHAVTGAYAKPIFVDKLGASLDSISNGVPLEDFGHGHPDPNLTYAKDLVDLLFSEDGPDIGAASDGDAYAQEAIPYFKNGPKGLARSMPTSGALDRVAEKLNLPFFEVPTGWKFFGNLMDAGKLSICGEESFGTGSDHIREKDGIWAVLAWLSIIAFRNKDKKVGEKLTSVSDVVKEHWAIYGRNFFSRYDYEECESEGANKMMSHLGDLVSKSKSGDKYGSYVLQFADDFSYTDPVDGSVASKQGVRFVFSDGSRIIYRLSGTGSAGATVRIYIEQFEPDTSKHDVDAQTSLKPLIDLALSLSKLEEFTGREKPTVIT
ncbi:Phosphoglucomutase, chloroplastic, partial [Cucurbita argyrosperma subsp. sororia]